MGYDDLSTMQWTTREAAEHAGVSTATIRSWVHRRHLVSIGDDEHGYPLYAALDVIKAEKMTRDRARRRYVVVAAA